MTTIACILAFLWIKSHLFKKNSSHTKNQLNGYNITGDINGRPVHTTRTYRCNAFFRTHGPYVRVVCTGP